MRLFVFISVLLILVFSMIGRHTCFSFFFFNDTATTEIYTLSLHDALPISQGNYDEHSIDWSPDGKQLVFGRPVRSEEHTSELQSHLNLVCRLLLEKKKTIVNNYKRCIALDRAYG